MRECECTTEYGVLSVMCLNCSEDVWEAAEDTENTCICGFLSAISATPVTRPCGALACVNKPKEDAK